MILFWGICFGGHLNSFCGFYFNKIGNVFSFQFSQKCIFLGLLEIPGIYLGGPGICLG